MLPSTCLPPPPTTTPTAAAQARPTSGDVVAVGDGQVGTKTHAFSLAGGETILYSKFGIGVTELEVQASAPCT